MKQLPVYVVSSSLKADFVPETAKTLVRDHGISLSAQTMINSDQGVHYTCCRFSQIVNDSGLRQSMPRRANCRDNAPQESFFGRMKDGINLASCLRFEHGVTVIDDWMDYYNTDRHQWQLVKLSQDEFCLYATTGEYPLPILPPKTLLKPNPQGILPP